MALSIGGPMAWKDKLVTRLEQQKNAAITTPSSRAKPRDLS